MKHKRRGEEGDEGGGEGEDDVVFNGQGQKLLLLMMCWKVNTLQQHQTNKQTTNVVVHLH